MHVELEQLHVCHAYIKQARIEEFSSGWGGGGGPNFRKKNYKPKKKKTRNPKNNPTKWEILGVSVFVLLKYG